VIDNSSEMRKIMERIEKLDEIPGDPEPYFDLVQPHKDKNHPADEFAKPKKKRSSVVPSSKDAQTAIKLQDQLDVALEVAQEIEDIGEIPIRDRQELLKTTRAIQAKFV